MPFKFCEPVCYSYSPAPWLHSCRGNLGSCSTWIDRGENLVWCSCHGQDMIVCVQPLLSFDQHRGDWGDTCFWWHYRPAATRIVWRRRSRCLGQRCCLLGAEKSRSSVPCSVRTGNLQGEVCVDTECERGQIASIQGAPQLFRPVETHLITLYHLPSV